MENDMIERVAEAVLLASDCHLFTRDARWLGTGFEVCRYGTDDEDEIVVLSTHPDQAEADMGLAAHQARNAAIAVLTAMREPTEAMREAAKWHWPMSWSDAAKLEDSGKAWSCMIDAALSPPVQDPR